MKGGLSAVLDQVVALSTRPQHVSGAVFEDRSPQWVADRTGPAFKQLHAGHGANVDRGRSGDQAAMRYAGQREIQLKAEAEGRVRFTQRLTLERQGQYSISVPRARQILMAREIAKIDSGISTAAKAASFAVASHGEPEIAAPTSSWRVS